MLGWVHGLCAGACLVLGAVLLTAPKGTGLHRGLGAAYMALMALSVLAGYFIYEVNAGWPSIFHILGALALFALYGGAVNIRRYRIGRDQRHLRLHFQAISFSYMALLMGGTTQLLIVLPIPWPSTLAFYGCLAGVFALIFGLTRRWVRRWGPDRLGPRYFPDALG